MILFLEFAVGGVRGGETYYLHFHSFMKNRFPDVLPGNLSHRPPEAIGIIGNLIYSLALAKEKKPELIVIDVSSGIRNALAVRWMKKNNRKVLVIVQEQRLHYMINLSIVRWFVRQFEKYLMRNADILLVNSAYSAELARRKGADKDISCVIARPGLENYVSLGDRIHSRKENREDPLGLLFVGVCAEHKGIIYLVEAMNILKDLNIKLNIVGKYSAKDSYFRKMQKYIDRHNLRDRIEFHGFIEREQLARLYRESSLYVHPSLMEGYGMVLAEAMSFGMPIVASSAGAIPELIEDGINGILVRPRDSQGLAGAIRKLCRDDATRIAMGKENYRRLKDLAKWHDFDAVLEKEMIPAIESATGLKARR
jgi:glycosyltransferase involved in cell wall biosynthesis